MNSPGSNDPSSTNLDVKSHFAGREGLYRNIASHEYTRLSRSQSAAIAAGSPQQPNLPVKLSMVRLPDDESDFPDRLLVNVGRELMFYVFKSIWEPPDLNRPVHREVHKAFPTCHDINAKTCSVHGCATLVGFASGAFHISDPKREAQIYNEDKSLDKTKVTCIKWLPGSNQQYLVGFASGQLFHCDDSFPWVATPPSYQLHKHGDGYAVYTCKSRTNRNPLYRWMIGEGSLNAIAFSPCAKYLATVSHDGFLRIFIVETMELYGVCRSYFGGLLCLCWSPDSRFICFGGEDDLVHLYSVDARKVVARGRGHRSWVTAVSFDPVTSCIAPDTSFEKLARNNAPNHRDLSLAGQRITTYRFGSVGQDTQICFWELTDDIVKQAVTNRVRAGSIASPPSSAPNLPLVTNNHAATKKPELSNLKKNLPLLGGRGDKSSSNKSSGAAAAVVKEDVPKPALAPRLDEVPLLEPLVCKRIANERLNDLIFHEDCVLVSTQEGIVQVWSRPGRGNAAANGQTRQNST